MKNKIAKLILIVLFSLTLAVFGLVACDTTPDGVEKGLKSIEVVEAKISFMKGDEFTTGDEFKVVAKYDDGKTVDVTKNVKLKYEKGFDMNVPGNYQVTVSYGGKKAIYTVYVNDADDVLRKIEIDSTEVQKTYALGDTVSLDGLVLDLTYENAQGVKFKTKTSSLKNFDVDVVHESGTAISDVFTGLGTYTVTVSFGNISDSFDVTVDSINISTVQSAIVVGSFFKSEVVSGVQHTKTASAGGSDIDSFHYNYEFGDNFTKVEETIDQDVIDYRSVDEEGFFNVRLHEGQMINSGATVPEMMGGASFLLWYYSDTKYGAEDALLSLYEHAKQCTNKDLEEKVDEEKREYKFKFSGLELNTNSYDYYETEVEFALGEKYNIKDVKIIQYFYENNSAWEGTTPTFITDENGITRPNDRFTSKFTITASQTAGKRTATNPYSRDQFKIKSYNLKYNGKTLEEGEVIQCVANTTYRLDITNISPQTASFSYDAMKFDYEGNYGNAQEEMISNEHFIVSFAGSGINITAFHGGKWTFSFITSNIEKHVTIDVTGAPPTTMSGSVYNASSKVFYSDNKKTVEIGGYVYFYGAVNQYANAAQTAEITSANANGATVTEVEIGGVKCFRFSATESGVYTVVTSSSVTSGLNFTFTFTVSDMPDFDTLLDGSYTAEDVDGNIYAFSFTNSESGTGSITVVKTPTQVDGTPITDKAQTAKFTYSVNGMEIVLIQTEGPNLGIDLYVNAEGSLVLEDMYSNSYVLTRA